MQLNGYFLRPAAISDLQDIHSLICALEEQTFEYQEFEKAYSKNLQNPDVFYQAALVNNRVIAFGSLQIQTLLHHCGPVAEIQELYVVPEYRCRGLGGQIVRKLKEKALESGCAILEVSCDRGRFESHRFYEQQGFAGSHFKFTLKLS
ncbi:MAG: GNAT family N-acetyltransferase [Candidatus Wallbacteria bacterium]|nr:GNAT family N-acetyltransferase [Candidatus Wallbacteria bacterium]